MTKRFVSAVFAVFAFVGTTFGQKPAPILPPTPAVVPQPVPVLKNLPHPGRLLKSINVKNITVQRGTSKSDHLHQAATHLEAAGLKDEAAKFRNLALTAEREATQQLLLSKIAQRDQLQREIETLEKELGTHQPLTFQIQIWELDVDELEARNLDWAVSNRQEQDAAQLIRSRFLEHPSKRSAPPFLEDATAINSVLEKLRKAGIAKVFARPTIQTRIGQAATLNTGGEFPILVPQRDGKTQTEWRQFGTSIELTPTLADEDRLRIELGAEVGERDFENAVNLAGHQVPGLTTRRMNTQIEMQSGQTVLISGLSSARKSRSEPNGFVVLADQLAQLATTGEVRPASARKIQKTSFFMLLTAEKP